MTAAARQDVEDVVVRLFVATDRRDWATVEACLADTVILDMTSMAGGEPARMTAGEVVAMWTKGLEPIDHVHHQVGNFQIDVDRDRASVFCYGIALHYREKISNSSKSRTFVGSYDIHLARTEGKWRIELFRFNLKFIEGNRELEIAT
ncbi:MAG: nuclear transport factor 2 family protein [Acidobacteriota bacterium]|nr:nuclear transport factor 2 family protein [Acidobacteriota bacterium]